MMWFARLAAGSPGLAVFDQLDALHKPHAARRR